MIRLRDISVVDDGSGWLMLYVMDNGRYVERRYLHYTKAEAKKLFKEFVNGN